MAAKKPKPKKPPKPKKSLGRKLKDGLKEAGEQLGNAIGESMCER